MIVVTAGLYVKIGGYFPIQVGPTINGTAFGESA